MRITRDAFCKELAERLGMKKKDIKRIIEAEEDYVYEIIATCNSVWYSWGILEGISKPPTKIAGMYTEYESVKKNHGWSNWKIGYPTIKWTKAAKACELHTPEEYFAQDSIRYTTKARRFRQDAKLPEIPEYAGLSEEKIIELCKKADNRELDKLGESKRYDILRHEADKVRKISLAEYYLKIGYFPEGMLWDDALGDQNYTGRQRDAIDFYEAKYITNESNPVEKLEYVRIAIDIGIFKNEMDKHEYLYDLEKELIAEIKEKGLIEKKHVRRNYIKQRNLISYKDEKDPWGMDEYTQKIYKNKKEIERVKLAKMGRLYEDISDEEMQKLLNTDENSIVELDERAFKKKPVGKFYDDLDIEPD